MLLQQGQNGAPPAQQGVDHIEVIEQRLRPGWTVHLTHDQRYFYCNHLTQTSCWVPPVEAWVGGLPYGWEEALDHDGRPYYINHLNKTTTYEDPRKDWSEDPPLPRDVTLTRHPELGFGFVAGSEKPVIVRFVTEGGPSVDLLQPGDQILSINGEDVKKAPRDHVIKLVRACKEVVHLSVCQPPLDNSSRKSALLSAAKKAKLKSNPSRVRFAEGVVVNGSPLFPPSTFSNGEPSIPVLPNVLKVYLENGQTKSFKYDSNTTVREVVQSLLQKLCIRAAEHFSLVVEHFKSLRRNKLTLLDPNESVARIAARPGSHNLRCLFRVAFVPKEAAELAQKDMNAFEYLYMQCCNDVVQERYAPELKYDLALRLAALHIHQHSLAHNLAGKLTVKAVEREFGLERFVPVSLMGTMKRKELRKLLAHFLKLNQNILPGQKSLTSFQAKLHYLNIVGELPSYGAKCFSTNIRDANMETVLLVSPKFGISQILGIRNSVPVALADIEDMSGVVVRREDELSRIVRIYLQNRELFFSLEDRDAEELVLVLQGYYHLLTGDDLSIDEERDPWREDCAPLYLSPHAVRPAPWSYKTPYEGRPRIINFSVHPPYQPLSEQHRIKMNGHIPGTKKPVITNGTKCGVDDNMNLKCPAPIISDYSTFNGGFHIKPHSDLDLQTVVSMEILEGNECQSDEVLRRVAEMQALVQTSEQYLTEQKNDTRAAARSLARLPEETDSDNSHMSSVESEAPPPGQLKHSDSLLLLTQGQRLTDDIEDVVKNLDLNDLEHSESDTDSTCTPAGSPLRRKSTSEDNRLSTQSFGLRSPDALGQGAADLQEYLKKLQDDNALPYDFAEGTLYLDPDIIDLTAIPPPATPDDGVNYLPSQPSLPPTPFADDKKPEPLIYWGEEDQDSITTTMSSYSSDELEAFLAQVTVAPPAPAQEITPEEILSYIIPPPPKIFSPSEGTPLTNGTPEQLRSESNKRQVPYSPRPTRKSSLCCTGPRASPDSELPRREVSGPLKLSLYSGGGGSEVGANSAYCTLPKPPNRIIQNGGVGFSTLPKNTSVNGCGVVSCRNAVNMPRNGLTRCFPEAAAPIEQECTSKPDYQHWNGHVIRRDELVSRCESALSVLLVRLDQLAAQCDRAQSQGGGCHINEEKFQVAKENISDETCELVTTSKNLIKRLTSNVSDAELAESCSCCLQRLRRLSEICSDLAIYTGAPLATRNIVLRVHDVVSACRHVLKNPTTQQSEHLANALASLLRCLRVFE